jgi:hypothetical protein
MNENTPINVICCKCVVELTMHTQEYRSDHREQRREVNADNLAAVVSLEKVSELYKLQLDVVWLKEEPLLSEAYRNVNRSTQAFLFVY